VACPDNETSTAPFLGMSGCICAAGIRCSSKARSNARSDACLWPA
jgi:hypothetical protein